MKFHHAKRSCVFFAPFNRKLQMQRHELLHSEFNHIFTMQKCMSSNIPNCHAKHLLCCCMKGPKNGRSVTVIYLESGRFEKSPNNIDMNGWIWFITILRIVKWSERFPWAGHQKIHPNSKIEDIIMTDLEATRSFFIKYCIILGEPNKTSRNEQPKRVWRLFDVDKKCQQ